MTSYDQDYGQPTPAKAAARAISQAGRVPQAPMVIPSIEALKAYPPGRPWRELAHELGVSEEDMLLLAANENVLGPSPAAVAAATASLPDSNLYPDGGATSLKLELARRHGVDPRCIAIGNGSNEIIELLVRTFVGPEQTVLTAWPSFVVYRLVTQAQGRDVLVAPLLEDRYDLPALAALADYRTKLVFIANPNNPTGTYVTEEEIEDFLARVPRTTIVVIDEAYFEYTVADDFPDALEIQKRHPQVVVLRTFSKAHGLAGLRVGYGVMATELVDYIDRVRQPYNTNAVAQAAALGALSDPAHIEKSKKLVREGMAQFESALSDLNVELVPSQANFLVVKLPVDGAAIQAQLKSRGILVRAMGGYGMPNAIRVTIGTNEMNQRVIDALRGMVG